MTRPLPLALTLAALAAPALSAQPSRVSKDARAGDSGVFVALLGSDTVVVERYARAGDRIEGQLVSRAPSVMVVQYSGTIGRNGQLTELEYMPRAANGAPLPNAPTSITLRVVGDSVRREAKFADSTSVRTVAVPANALLTFGQSYAMYEMGMRQMRAAGQNAGGLLFYNGAPRVGQPQAVTLVGADSARIEYFGDPVYVAFDRDGRLVGWDGSRTTNKVVVRRVPNADLQAIAAGFAARPAMGQTSPRDTARAEGSDTLFVDYGRPSVRGRTVWGGTLVPPGLIWRTGANQATHLRTSRALMIGETMVPAGTYTLYTWPTGSGYQLVINKQTGQWGTVYDQAQDLARVPLTVTALASPVEQFTVAIDRSGNGGTLRMMWDTKQLAVPFMFH